MPYVESRTGTRLHVKDWGAGRPVVLLHGWPLTSDSWESQALHLADNGFRVISYDRRGFGRSGQPWTGYDYDTMADDLAAVMDTLDLADAVLVGFSMGGGEVVRYMARHGTARVGRAVLVASIAPYMHHAPDNPDGVPEEVFEGIRAGLRADRPAFVETFLSDFYGEGTPNGGVSDAMRHWAWGMAMQASPRATLECVSAFSGTDLRPEMAHVTVPTLVIHGTGDKTVPIEPTGRQAARMLPNATLTEYEGAPHGLTATHADRLNADLLAFARG